MQISVAGEPGAVASLAAWLLTYLAHSTLLLGGTWLVTRAVRSPVVRDIFWKAAVAGPLVTSFAVMALPRAAAGPHPVVFPDVAATILATGGSTPQLAVPAGLLLAGWLFAAAVGAVRLEHGRRRYWRAVGRRETLADADTVRSLRSLQERTGCTRTVFLTTSCGIGAPAAIGSAEICLPSDSFRRLSMEQRESVLAHELGHLIRRDPWWRFGTLLLVALLPVQPLLRLARREMRECAELVCDDLAVELTGGGRSLVESLAILAAALRPGHAAASALGGDGSLLVRRAARAMAARRESSPAVVRRAAVVLALSMVATGAALSPVVAAPRPAQPRLLPPPPALTGGAARYVVRMIDGRELTVHTDSAGRISYDYRIHGRTAVPDTAARRWIAEIIAAQEAR